MSKFWIGIILFLVGIGCIIAALIWQQVLCYQMFGAIFDHIFIPHWSAWLYCGGVPAIVGLFLIGGVS